MDTEIRSRLQQIVEEISGSPPIREDYEVVSRILFATNMAYIDSHLFGEDSLVSQTLGQYRGRVEEHFSQSVERGLKTLGALTIHINPLSQQSIGEWAKLIEEEKISHGLALASLDACRREQIGCCFHRSIWFDLVAQGYGKNVKSRAVDGHWKEGEKEGFHCFNVALDIGTGNPYLVDTALLDSDGFPLIKRINYDNDSPEVRLSDGKLRVYTIQDTIKYCSPEIPSQ